MKLQIQTLSSNKFTLGSNFLEVNGTLTNDEWKNAYTELSMFNEVTNWWLGDFLLAIEAKGKDIMSTIGDAVGLDHRTLDNVKSVCKKIPKDKRVEGVSFTHHAEAWKETKLHGAMIEALKLAKKENLTVLIMRDKIRDKYSDKSMTIIPEIKSRKEDESLTHALNAITDIKRFLNNSYSKLSPQQQSIFKTQYDAVNDLYGKTI
jgi:hypothetical protein